MNVKRLLPCLLACAVAASANLRVHAEENTNAATQPGPERRPTNMPRMVADDLTPALNVLTEEQRTSLTRTLQNERQNLSKLQAGLQEARRDLLLASVNSKFDEAAMRKQASVVANLQSEIYVLRMKALSQIQPPLSAEQIEKIKGQMTVRSHDAGQPLERNVGRPRILQSSPRDENDLPPKQ